MEVLDCFLHFRVERFGAAEALEEVVEGGEDFAVLGHHGAALSGEGVIFGLLRADAFILKKVAVIAGQLLHQGTLLVISLENAVLVGAEFLELGFEELLFVVGNLLLVEDEDIRNVVVVNLSL